MIRALNLLRLAAMPIAYGLSGALIGGTLNRVMIVELGYPATLVALLFAIPLIISPLRVWLGHTSDTKPILGRRRVPYVLLGAALIAVGLICITMLAVSASHDGLVVTGLVVSFILYGVGRSLGLNSFQALLAERFSDRSRGRAITLFEVPTLLGLVMGSGLIGKAMEAYDAQRTVLVGLVVALAVCGLAMLATLGQERRASAATPAQAQAASLPFRQVLTTYVLADPQIRRFFAVVFCTFVGTLAQDVLLEPFGALVLSMSVGQTSRLTMFWGLGVMASMVLSGVVLLRYINYLRLMRAGIAASMVVFVGLIAIGVAGHAEVFPLVVAFMGLATGVAGAGMLAGVINFTTKARAGLLLGVWGVANMAGHAFGSVMGGAIVDIGTAVTGSPLLAYCAVFALEVCFLGAALWLTAGLRITESRASAEERALIAASVA